MRALRILNEVRLARRITHPAVCRVFDVGEADGEVFFSMELVQGEDLATLLKRVGRLPSEKVIDIGHQLCAGLAAAHAQGVLHRDLKPANVLIDDDGHVRITDFGIAVTRTEDGRHTLIGTPGYMAPEQLSPDGAVVGAHRRLRARPGPLRAPRRSAPVQSRRGSERVAAAAARRRSCPTSIRSSSASSCRRSRPIRAIARRRPARSPRKSAAERRAARAGGATPRMAGRGGGRRDRRHPGARVAVAAAARRAAP